MSTMLESGGIVGDIRTLNKDTHVQTSGTSTEPPLIGMWSVGVTEDRRGLTYPYLFKVTFNPYSRRVSLRTRKQKKEVRRYSNSSRTKIGDQPSV